jgi:hypothetical protein
MVRTWGAQRSVPAISKVAVKGDGQLSADSESKIALCAFFLAASQGHHDDYKEVQQASVHQTAYTPNGSSGQIGGRHWQGAPVTQ